MKPLSTIAARRAPRADHIRASNRRRAAVERRRGAPRPSLVRRSTNRVLGTSLPRSRARVETKQRLEYLMSTIKGTPLADLRHSFSYLTDPVDPQTAFPGSPKRDDLLRLCSPKHPTVELRPENFEVFGTDLGRDSDFGDENYRNQMAVVGVVTDRTNGQPAGHFLSLFFHNHQNESFADHVYLFVDRETKAPGVGRAQLRALDGVAQAMGIQTEMITAWYLGRYVWAKEGYTFSDSQWEAGVLRKALKKFRKKHGIKKKSLRIERDDKLIPIRPRDLQQPADFAALRWTNGSVRTTVELADGYVEDANLPLGKAFLLDDKTPAWRGVRSVQGNNG